MIKSFRFFVGYLAILLKCDRIGTCDSIVNIDFRVVVEKIEHLLIERR